MIAVTLGLIILAALTAFFVQTSDNRREMDRNTRQIENGRYAIETLRDDLTLAGFYADTAPLIAPTTWKANDVCPADLAAFGRKLDGIAQKVDEHLFQPSLISIQQSNVSPKVEI